MVDQNAPPDEVRLPVFREFRPPEVGFQPDPVDDDLLQQAAEAIVEEALPQPFRQVANAAPAMDRVREELRRIDLEREVKKSISNLQVVIGSDGLEVTREERISKMSLDTFFSNFVHASQPQFSGILPSGTRLVQRDGEFVRFLIEIEPNIFNVAQAGNKQKYQLAMPWQYFYFVFKSFGKTVKDITIPWQFNDARVFWSRNRFGNIDEDTVIFARLPNIYQRDGKICFGNTAPDSTLPLHERIEAVINDFFAPESVFNGDLGWNFPNGYRSFRDWARDTKDNPLCFLNWRDWVELRHASRISDWFPPIADASVARFNEFVYALNKKGGN